MNENFFSFYTHHDAIVDSKQIFIPLYFFENTSVSAFSEGDCIGKKIHIKICHYLYRVESLKYLWGSSDGISYNDSKKTLYFYVLFGNITQSGQQGLICQKDMGA